jgi:hypothetical protein
MILHLPAPQHKRITLPHQCAAAILTYIALPLSAAAHVALIVWSLEQDFLLFELLSTLTDYLPRRWNHTLDGLIDIYVAFMGGTVFAFLLSWIGFALLLPIFQLQRKFGWDGWLPTTLVGAALGALAVMPISLGPLDFSAASRHMFGHNPAPFFTTMGALHAATFWAVLISLTPKKPLKNASEPLALFGPNTQNPPTCNTLKQTQM